MLSFSTVPRDRMDMWCWDMWSMKRSTFHAGWNFRIWFIDNLCFLCHNLNRLSYNYAFSGKWGVFPPFSTRKSIKITKEQSLTPWWLSFPKWQSAKIGIPFKIERTLSSPLQATHRYWGRLVRVLGNRWCKWQSVSFSWGCCCGVWIHCIEPFQCITLVSICMA